MRFSLIQKSSSAPHMLQNLFSLTHSSLILGCREREERKIRCCISNSSRAAQQESCANICQHRTINFLFHFGSSQILPFFSTLIISLFIKSNVKNGETFAAFLAGGCVCTWLLLTERIEHMFRCCAINSSPPQTNNQMRKMCRRAHKRQLHCRKKCFYAN